MRHPAVSVIHVVRPCRFDETEAMLAIINAAATVYEGAIPADCWHRPYMPANQITSEMAAGVVFHGCEIEGVLAGIMGFQHVRDVHLIRHAYVLPEFQGLGIGGTLIRHFEAARRGSILIGTWAAATWAIAFYQQHGYRLTSDRDKVPLLKTYWTVSDRQIEASVVLAKPAVEDFAGRPEVHRQKD